MGSLNKKLVDPMKDITFFRAPDFRAFLVFFLELREEAVKLLVNRQYFLPSK